MQSTLSCHHISCDDWDPAADTCTKASNHICHASGVSCCGVNKQSIGTCSAPSCTGAAPRVVDASTPNPAFPTFGDVAGGFEVYISEGYSHVDVLTAEDDATNNVLAPLSAFIGRNAQ